MSGVQRAEPALAIAGNGESVVALLPTPGDVRSVLESDDGVCAGAYPGMLDVEISSVGPVTMRVIAELGYARDMPCLDAPESGGVNGACEGTLVIMNGGERGCRHCAMPIFEVLGRKFVYV